jgi:hypothetical protein
VLAGLLAPVAAGVALVSRRTPEPATRSRPHNHPWLARDRRNVVIAAMAQVDTITPAEAATAIADPLDVLPDGPVVPGAPACPRPPDAGFFCQRTVDHLEKAGFTADQLATGGYGTPAAVAAQPFFRTMSTLLSGTATDPRAGPDPGYLQPAPHPTALYEVGATRDAATAAWRRPATGPRRRPSPPPDRWGPWAAGPHRATPHREQR